VRLYVFSGLFFLFLFTSLSVEAQDRELSVTEVEVQWQEEAGAEKYHIEVKTKSGRFVKKFESKKTLFKFRAQAGQYMIRAQTETNEGRLGLWTDWVDVNIPPKKVEFKANFPTNIVAQPEVLNAPVRVSWEGSGSEAKYEIRIVNEHNEVIKVLETLTPDAQIELPPGRYSVEVVAIAEDGLRSKSAKLNSAIVISPAARLPAPKFKVAPGIAPQLGKKKAKRLEFESKAGQSNVFHLEKCPLLAERWTLVEKGILGGPIWSPRADLPPGKYRVHFWSESAGWEKSPSVSWEFVVKPTEEAVAWVL
jgi:hypothetical protein